jgi:peptidoglycan/LPS O-acetylase OafA/YrhL
VTAGTAPSAVRRLWAVVRPPTSAARAARVADQPPMTVRPRARSAPLDGLRGLALLAVLAYHVAPAGVPGGFLGVEVFFVLSGYLLGSVLLEEHRRTGAIDTWRYAVRRARRIAPPVAALLAALVVLGPVVAPDAAHRLAGDVAASVVGMTNWHLIAGDSSYFELAGRPSSVRHLWSIAIEVQFYALCPFLVAGIARLRRRRLAVAVLAGGVVASAAVMAVLHRAGDPSRAYYGTDARIGALLTGVLLAVLLAARPGAGDRTGWRCRRAEHRVDRLGAAALAALGLLFLVADDRAQLSYPGAFLAAQVATVLVIVAVRRAGPAAAALRTEPLRWLGVRSFGIYLWHWPLVVLFRPGVDVSWSPAAAALVTVGLAVLLGSLSYGLAERPQLRRRRASTPPGGHERRAWNPVPLAGAALATAVALLSLARLPTTDPLAETLQAGERLLAAQEPATAPPPAEPRASGAAVPAPGLPDEAASEPLAPPPAPEPDLPTPQPAPPAAAQTAVVAGVPVTAIGDSVMISAAGALQSRLGSSVHIDARSSRQFAEGITLARRLREENRLTPVTVVHLGNNGPVRDRDVDALMGELAGVAKVVLVNVRVGTPWRDSVNQVFADAAARHPTISLVDWHRSSDGQRGWFQSDGTHFRTTSGPGASAYADLIVSAIFPPAPVPPPAPAPSPPTPMSEEAAPSVDPTGSAEPTDPATAVRSPATIAAPRPVPLPWAVSAPVR